MIAEEELMRSKKELSRIGLRSKEESRDGAPLAPSAIKERIAEVHDRF